MRLRWLLVVVSALALAGQGLAQGCEGWNTSVFFLSATLTEVVDCLEAGADINARNSGGYTPLHIAARYTKDPTLIWVLIDAGADVNAKSETGATPLHAAILFNCAPDVVAVLIAAGADPNALNNAELWQGAYGGGQCGGRR